MLLLKLKLAILKLGFFSLERKILKTKDLFSSAEKLILVESIKEIKGELFLQFSSPDKISLETLKYLTENYKKEMRFDLSEKPKIILGFEDKNLRDPIEVLSILLKDNEK